MMLAYFPLWMRLCLEWNVHGSGKVGFKKGPEMPWHFSPAASSLRIAVRGDASAEAANRAAIGREDPSILKLYRWLVGNEKGDGIDSV